MAVQSDVGKLGTEYFRGCSLRQWYLYKSAAGLEEDLYNLTGREHKQICYC